jgi:hypothetical protein
MVVSILMILSSLVETDDPVDEISVAAPVLPPTSRDYTAGRGALPNRKVVIAAWRGIPTARPSRRPNGRSLYLRYAASPKPRHPDEPSQTASRSTPSSLKP